eukprot:6184410-Pleurochrysis_carterae.AAC.6
MQPQRATVLPFTSARFVSSSARNRPHTDTDTSPERQLPHDLARARTRIYVPTSPHLQSYRMAFTLVRGNICHSTPKSTHPATPGMHPLTPSHARARRLAHSRSRVRPWAGASRRTRGGAHAQCASPRRTP